MPWHRRNVRPGAIDEETERYHHETERELGGNGQVLVVARRTVYTHGQYRAEDENPDRIEGLELRRRPVPQVQPNTSEGRVDVAQRKQIQRGGHLLVENEIKHGLHRQYQGSDQPRTFLCWPVRDQVGEDAQNDDRRPHTRKCAATVLVEDKGGSEHRRHAGNHHGAQLFPGKGLIVGLGTDVIQRVAHRK